MTGPSEHESHTLDFHLIVNSVQGNGDLGFVAGVAHAPVERFGKAFALLRTGERLKEDLQRDGGMEISCDRRGNFNARWKEALPEATGEPATVGEEDASGQLQEGMRRVRTGLFEFLFPSGSDVYELFRRSCERAVVEDKTLRIRLELPAVLSNLPWEMMHCPPEHGDAAVVLQAQRQISIVRYMCEIVSSVETAPEAGPPVVLLILADPKKRQRSSITQSFRNEWDKLKEIFRRHDASLGCELIEGADTLGQLRDKVNRFGDRIIGIHFIGHGDTGNDGGFLVVEGPGGAVVDLYWDRLTRALLGAPRLRWVFLNACTTGHTPAGCPLSGLATTLSVVTKVPTVVAYTRPVETSEAEMLAPTFYSLLLDERRGIDDAVRNLMKQQPEASSGLVVLVRMVAGRMQSSISMPHVLATPGAAAPAVPAVPPHRAAAPMAAVAPMVLVPAGPFRRGLTEAQLRGVLAEFTASNLAIEMRSAETTLRQERPEEVSLPAFEIDETPVTNAQFRAFADATQWVTEAERRKLPQTWRAHQDRDDHPVVLVSFEDALEYCKWARKRLPSADEWKKACRGTQSSVYPWGDRFDASRCNTAESQRGWETTSVRNFPQGRSPYGCYDMVGNVEEWTSDALDDDRRIVLGGSWCMSCQVYGLPVLHRVASKSFFSNELGFRCVRDVAS